MSDGSGRTSRCRGDGAQPGVGNASESRNDALRILGVVDLDSVFGIAGLRPQIEGGRELPGRRMPELLGPGNAFTDAAVGPEIAGVTSAFISALAAASFMAGVSLGSAVGGEILRRGGGYELLPLVGAGLTALGLIVFLIVTRLHELASRVATTPESEVSVG